MAENGRPPDVAWEGEMFRLLAENVKDYAIFIVDPHRHILSWSKGAERLLGFTEEEIVGKQCDCFFTPEDVRRGVPQKELEQALATGRGEDDRWHLRKDGSRFWASGAVTPLKDEGGRLRGFAKIMRDRTEMRLAEEAAHERERQLQLLTDHAPVLIAHIDSDRRYKFVNKPFAARFGLHPREVVGRRLRDVLGGPAYASIERQMDAALAGERVEFEVEVPYAGLGPQVMRCAYDPEIDAEGRVVGVIAALVNVTERRQAREALRESEERLRTLSDNLPHGAVYQIMGDREGRRQLTYISGGVERLLGVTPVEVLADASALYDLIHEEDRPRVAAAEEVALRDLTAFDCEFRSWTHSGRLVWVHARSAPRPLSNGQTVWEGILADVTARKNAEADLAHLHAESDRLRRTYETALCNTPDLNFTFDLEGRFTYANEALLALLGKPLREVVGRGFLELGYPPELAERLLGQIRQVIQARQPLRAETSWTSTAGTREYEYNYVPVIGAGGAGGAVEAVVGSAYDITERKQAEAELRSSAERLIAALDASDTGTFRWNPATGEFLEFDDRLKRLFGVRCDEPVRTTEDFLARVHPDDRPGLTTVVAACREGADFEKEYRVVLPGGEVRWLYDRARMVRAGSGEPAYLVGACTNITPRKRAEEEFRLSRERLDLVVNSVDVGLWYCDLPFDKLIWNAKVKEHFGLPADADVTIDTFYERLHPDDRERTRQAIEQSVRDRTAYDIEYRTVGLDGRERWVRAIGRTFYDPAGQPARFDGITLDVTERVLAEQALKQSEERLRLAVEATGVGIFDYDPASGRQVLNGQALQLWGFPPGTNPTPEAILNAVHPDDREWVRAATLESLNPAGSGRFSIKHRIVRPGGEVRWVASSGQTQFSSNGKRSALRSLGTMVDITEKEEGDQRLREADRRKDEFLATLAHELRNPLAPIRNGLQVMKMAAGNAEAIEQARGMMERQLSQMVRLVDDLLDVSRITRGKLQLRLERVELATVVQSAVEGSRPLIESNRHDLTIHLPAEPVYLEADPTRLAQVFGNLLTNAAKYTDRGGRITLTAQGHGSEVVVSVRDNGIGIAPDHLPKLFEMFSQVDSALERSQGGLGIGLSLVKGLVRMHGGNIEARSEGLGQGSELVVRLPVPNKTPVPRTSQPSGGAEATSRTRRRILVADDNRDAADSLAMMLRLAGHEVHAVHDGKEAVEAVGWFRPDLALLDIGMPRLNGFDAARCIREQPGGKNIFLVAITGWGQEEDKRRTTEAGFDLHLTKPVDPAALENLLSGLNAT